MKREMYDNMYLTDTYHWWFRGKREIVLGLSKPELLANRGGRMIDFGCGCGMMLGELAQYGEVAGADFSPIALEYCKEKIGQGGLHQIDLSMPVEPWEIYDFGIALDILEHIENDLLAAQNLFRFIRTGGTCIITVPAYQWLWSAHDENCMHKRRYNKAMLNDLLLKAGFRVEYISYYNTLLFPPAMLVRLVSKLLRLDKASSAENDFRDSPLNRMLYHIFHLEKGWICKGRTFPFGLSLIAKVTKPKDCNGKSV